MSFKKWITFPFLLLALSACINDDRDDCVTEDNLTLVFTYSDAKAGKTVTDYMTHADVLLFDADGRLYLQLPATASELQAGKRVTVPAGTYYAVAWANVHSNSAYNSFTPGVTTLDECLLQIDSNETGDQVYYAPYKEKPAATRAGMTVYEVAVPYGERVVHTLDFVRAHRSIYVEIYGHRDGAGTTSVPATIVASQLWSRYDFHFTSQADRRDYRQQTVAYIDNSAVPYTAATFHSAFGKINGVTNISVVRTSDQFTRVSVNLRQFVIDNALTDTDDIYIRITFLDDLGVSVTVPEWKDKPVEPGVSK